MKDIRKTHASYVRFTERQHARLRHLAECEGATVAALLRRAAYQVYELTDELEGEMSSEHGDAQYSAALVG